MQIPVMADWLLGNWLEVGWLIMSNLTKPMVLTFVVLLFFWIISRLASFLRIVRRNSKLESHRRKLERSLSEAGKEWHY